MNSNIYLFLFAFGTIFWQRKRLQEFFQKIKNPNVATALYLLTGWFWMVFFEFQLEKLPFHPKPLTDLIVGLGFYIPYFAIWLALIKHYQFTLFEIFYLSGFGRIIFDFLITRKILTSAAATTSTLAALLVIIIQALLTLVIFGILTALPALYFRSPENKRHNKPLKQYLIGLTPNFLAAGAFVIWTIILKAIST